MDNLTIENFQTSVEQIKELPFDTIQKLEELVHLIFEKAIAEPRFCFRYAVVCKHLALVSMKNFTFSFSLVSNIYYIKRYLFYLD